MSSGLTVLIIGGYGTFGRRIVELLEDEPGLTLIVAGRSIERARAFRDVRSKARAAIVAVAFDRDGDVNGQLSSLLPNIVVDASGPFQAYGEDKYRVIEACIAHGSNYLDLADGADFVAGVPDIRRGGARGRRVCAVGRFEFPVLTAAAVRHLAFGMMRVDSICGGIAPSPYAGIGENVIRAVAGYAGGQTDSASA